MLASFHPPLVPGQPTQRHDQTPTLASTVVGLGLGTVCGTLRPPVMQVLTSGGEQFAHRFSASEVYVGSEGGLHSLHLAPHNLLVLSRELRPRPPGRRRVPCRPSHLVEQGSDRSLVPSSDRHGLLAQSCLRDMAPMRTNRGGRDTRRPSAHRLAGRACGPRGTRKETIGATCENAARWCVFSPGVGRQIPRGRVSKSSRVAVRRGGRQGGPRQPVACGRGQRVLQAGREQNP